MPAIACEPCTCDASRERLAKPMFFAAWRRALMLHYALPPARLQPLVPFELDLRDGTAWVSLVAFTQARLRPSLGGVLAEALSAPLAHHVFFNVRTYVRVQDEPGIFFLAEWIPNPLARLAGPLLYGLPYRLGRLRQEHHHEAGVLRGSVTAAMRQRPCFVYEASVAHSTFAPAASGSLTEFLMERYSAWTQRGPCARRFRVWHAPWPQTQVHVRAHDRGLLALSGSWHAWARPVFATYSSGVEDVEIGRPERGL